MRSPLAVLLSFVSAPAFAGGGDVDGDGSITVNDVQCGIVVSLWEVAGDPDDPPTCIPDDAAHDAVDLNCDGEVNVVDVVMLVELSLGMPLAEEAMSLCVVEEPLFSGTFLAPVLPTLTTVDLPKPLDYPGAVLWGEADGLIVLSYPDERTAKTMAGGCIDLVLACYSEDVRNVSGCLANVAQCESDTPWLNEPDAFCCDPTCTNAYLGHRASGLRPPHALVEAVIGDDSCMPGMNIDTGRGVTR